MMRLAGALTIVAALTACTPLPWWMTEPEVATVANPTATWTTITVGSYAVTGERLTVIAPSNGQTRGTVPVLFAHGFAGDAISARNGDLYRILSEIASRGFTVLAADYGGGSTWGNDATITTFDQVLNYAVTGLGVRSDRIVLAGESMGTLGALNVAWRNTNRVAAIWLNLPIVSLAHFHDDPTGFAGAIETAYGGFAGYTAALPTHDPGALLNENALIPVPMRLDYRYQDGLIRPADVTAYANYVGALAVGWPGVHADGHDLDPNQPADWLAATVLGS